MRTKLVTIKPSERVFLAGKTGSGKTYLARYLLRSFRRLIVIDSKGTLYNWGLEPWNRKALKKLGRGEDVRARVTFDTIRDIEDAWEDMFADLYEKGGGNFVLYIDETYGVTPFGNRAPVGLTALYTRGREFNIGVWSATQRPLGVPLIEKSEAEHFFMFRLILKGDRQHMGEFLGEDVAERIIPHEHGFFYKHIAWERAAYVPLFTPKVPEVQEPAKSEIGEVINA
jgi:hypothetical protein